MIEKVLRAIFTYSARLVYTISMVFGVKYLFELGLYILPITIIFTVPGFVAYNLDIKIEKRMNSENRISLGIYFLLKLTVLFLFFCFFHFLGIDLIDLISNKGNVFI